MRIRSLTVELPQSTFTNATGCTSYRLAQLLDLWPLMASSGVPKRATSPGRKALSLALEARTTSRVTIVVGRGSEDDLK